MSQTLTLSLPDEAYSSLVRASEDCGQAPERFAATLIEQSLLSNPPDGEVLSRLEAFRAWKAPWRDRDDLNDVDGYVRQLREGGRLDRLNRS